MNIGVTQLKSVEAQAHPFCLVCSGSNPNGLALTFQPDENGGVAASFHPNPFLEGYEGLLHGGMTASLLDGAMTNCLFSQGIIALTADLRVRYRKPVLIGPEISLRAWVEARHSPLFLLRAELKQEGCVKATASAKFMKRHV
jgi:acyl-coenzyme A thioesterase PaaI-like protein